jgi:UDP-N-acetylmuramyl pentapeptide phosphotransferase/UDP-N-acetylglucosamine-1-phosphate transferase
MSTVLLIALLLAVLAYLSVGVIGRWAWRRRLLDVPNGRSSHTRPTPRGGGIPIVVLTLAAWVFWNAAFGDASWVLLTSFALGGLSIALISWLDDLYTLAFRFRLAVHAAAAIMLIGTVGFFDLSTIGMPGFGGLAWLGIPVTLVWIVGLTNAYNFMDGIDGIAGGQAVVAGLAWFALGWVVGMPAVGLLGLFVAATSFGFLLHNWSPARIFMGDVGSAFLGYTFAAVTVMAAVQDPRLIAGAAFVAPFVLDASFTFCRRLLKRENIFAAHRSHLYQRLIIAGFEHRTVSLLYTGMALFGAVTAIWSVAIEAGMLVAMTVTGLLFLGLWLLVVTQEAKVRKEEAEAMAAVVSEFEETAEEVLIGS